jgi:ribosome maturation factor RimP
VSSPGLERPLRTPAHWAWAVGRQVSIKTTPNHPAGRRVAGTVTSATDTSVTVALDEPVGESLTLPFDEIEKARTTFEWGPAPKPGGPKNKNTATTKPTTQKKKVQP